MLATIIVFVLVLISILMKKILFQLVDYLEQVPKKEMFLHEEIFRWVFMRGLVLKELSL